jgi:hypothetical protein
MSSPEGSPKYEGFSSSEQAAYDAGVKKIIGLIPDCKKPESPYRKITKTDIPGFSYDSTLSDEGKENRIKSSTVLYGRFISSDELLGVGVSFDFLNVRTVNISSAQVEGRQEEVDFTPAFDTDSGDILFDLAHHFAYYRGELVSVRISLWPKSCFTDYALEAAEAA